MRNIVLITWDSVRADHCSCYGYHKKTTPFLDKIAKKGIKYENAIVSGVPTRYSMGGILTSTYFNNGRITSEKTIAESLKQDGYGTAGFHTNPFASSFYGFDKGFDRFKDHLEFEKTNKAAKDGTILSMIKTGINKGLKKLGVNQKAKMAYGAINFVVRDRDIAGLKFEEFYQDILTWVNSIKNEDRPYFIWILLIDTHFPYTPPELNRMKRANLVFNYYKFYRAGGIETKNPPNLNKGDYRNIIDAYDGEIEHVDELTRQLWEDLKDTDPIFIVHADHGEGFGEHGFFGHPLEHYEYLIRVPLVIYNSDRRGVVKEPVSFLGLAPAICDLAGIENEFTNPSLLDNNPYTPPIIENKLENGHRTTIRDKQWKLITNPDRQNELYNIKKDPLEQHNKINEKPDIKKDMEKTIQDYKRAKKEREKLKQGVRRLKGLKKI